MTQSHVPYILKVIDGPEKGREFGLSADQKLVVGRDSASDTRINDPRVSRLHCEVTLSNGDALLTAMENAGPTEVRGETIRQRRLKSGDVFRIGDTFIRYDAGVAIDQSTMMTNSGATPAEEGGPLDRLVGKSFAHYELGPVISRGRTGVIFKSTNRENDATVAVKVLLPRVSSSEEQRERFVRAMRTMLPLKHPNIIKLHHAGKEKQFCWIAMDYVPGESMREVIARLGIRNMLDWRKVWEVAIDIGRALKYAGDRKIVHRNLSPANIICRKDDSVNLLGDLMLAKATEGNQSFDVTSPGQLVGQLSYMSPERTMSNSDIDARSDIYELGATLYALLTGRPPFEAGSQVEQIQKIRHEKPANPKEFQLAINDQFADLVMQMLANRPQDRFDSASNMLLDLERVGRFAGLNRA